MRVEQQIEHGENSTNSVSTELECNKLIYDLTLHVKVNSNQPKTLLLLTTILVIRRKYKIYFDVGGV